MKSWNQAREVLNHTLGRLKYLPVSTLSTSVNNNAERFNLSPLRGLHRALEIQLLTTKALLHCKNTARTL